MINPAEIPQIPGDMDALAEHARSLTTTGRAFASTGARVHSTWQGLAAVYDAPEAGQLLAATQPVSQVSSTVGDNLEAVAGALSTYAATVKPIKARLEALRAQAQTFVNSVRGDDDWRADEDKVDQHNQLLTQVNDAVAQWMDAQRTCANAINAVYGGTHYVADDGDGHRAPNEFGYTRDQLNAALGGDQGLPWGKPEEHDGGFLGDVGDFFVGLKDGFVQAITDLGALFGYADGQWSWSTAGQAWKGLGTFALALGTYGTGLGIALDQTTGVPGFKRGEMGNLLLNAGKSIIAYDQWGKGHNGRAAGMATFNIVSAVVGTKGAGGALRAVGAGLKGAEAGSVVTRVGAAAVRAGDFVAKMPTVDELGVKLLNKINIHIPRPDLSFAADGPSLGHHVDSHIPSTRGPDVAPMTHHGSSHTGGPSIGDGLRPSHHEGPNSVGHPPEHAHQGTSTKDDGGAGQHDNADGHHGDYRTAEHSPNDHPGDGGHGGHHAPDTPQHSDASSSHDHGSGEGPDGRHPASESGWPWSHDWSKLAQPTQHVHESAIHADAVPTRKAVKFLNEVFPGTPDVNAERLSWGRPFQQNCTHCVVTMEARLNGHDVVATPRPVLGNSLKDMLRALPPAKPYHMGSYDDIIRFMRHAGDDARGVVNIARPDGTAHVFNVVNTKHGVVFLDGQTGALARLEPGVSGIWLYHYK